MSAKEKASVTALSQLKDLIETANKVAGFIAALVALIAFKSGNRLLSYVFIVIGCASVDWFLWRAVRHKGLAAIVMSVATAASLVWIGVNARQDWLASKGVAFARAKPAEVLVIVAQFHQRGSSDIDPSGRIVDRLREELDRANMRNVRIERFGKIDSEDMARRIGQVHRAVSVIWGMYDDISIVPRFTIFRKTERPITTKLTEVDMHEPQALSLFIRQGLPAEVSYLAILTVGQLYYGEGRFDDALRTFDVAQANLEAGAQRMPASHGLSTLYLYRGLAHAGKEDFAQAIIALSRAIDLDPKNATAYNNRGVAYRRRGEPDQALTDYAKAIELDPAYAEAYNNRGDAFYQKGKLDEARADFSKAIHIAPELSLAYYNRGVVDDDQEQLDQAIADYTRAIDLDAKNANAYNNRGNAYRLKGKADRAIADFRKAIDLRPQYGPAYSNRGIAYFDLGRFDQAIADYTRAIDLDPKDAFAYNNRGNAHRVKGNLDAVLTDLNKATELEPRLPDPYNNRGLLYRQRGLKSLAIAEFETYLRLQPAANDRAQVEEYLRDLRAR